MKKTTIITTILAMLFFTACSLQEEPPFLSRDNVFGTLDNARNGLDGVYLGLSNWNQFSFQSHVLFNGFSGLFTEKNWRGLNTQNNKTLFALKPQPNSKEVEGVWRYHYTAISRANDVIASIVPAESPATGEERGLNDVLGQAYFIRAFEYFDLVRLWGDVPLRLEPMNTNNIHKPKAPAKEVYAQIIEDASKAQELMYPHSEQRVGYPGKEAANMLLAKVYMTLATADPSLQDHSEAEYWQMAYDEAIQVYGKYSLVDDYAALWGEKTGNNTPENIFEIQYNDVAGSGMPRLYTPRGATVGNNTWGRVNVNVEVYDDHVATYPGDPRINATFISSYYNVIKKKTVETYPITNRNNFNVAYPWPYKYWEKNVNLTGITDFKNFIVYRYADLLLMLSEISNELQNGEEFKYVEEVLTRVGLTPQAGYYNGQASFREAIMNEYRYELLGELQDVFTVRRRGYEWFKSHVIDKHNNAPTFDPKIDVQQAEDEETVMHLPIPSSEINTNQDINN